MSSPRTSSHSMAGNISPTDGISHNPTVNVTGDARLSSAAPEPAKFSLYTVVKEFDDLVKDDPTFGEHFRRRMSSPEAASMKDLYEAVIRDPDLLLPISKEHYDAIVSAFADMRMVVEEDRLEREEQKTEEELKRLAIIQDLEKGFLIRPSPSHGDEKDDTPIDLILCVKCRESGHSFRDCTISLELDRPHPNKKISSIRAVLAASKANVAPPKHISLKPRTHGDPLLPCRRCQSLPILDLLAQESVPRTQGSSADGNSKPVKTSCGLTYIEGFLGKSAMPEGDSEPETRASSLELMVNENKIQAMALKPMLKIDLGWALSLSFRQDCPLCVALLNSMPNNLYSRDAYIVLCSIDSSSRYIQTFSQTLKMERTARCLFALINNDPEIDEAAWAQFDLGRIANAPYGIQRAKETSKGNDEAFGGRLMMKGGVDVHLIRAWVSRCTGHHDETCRPLRSDVLGRIQLVDVVNRRLLNYAEAGSPDYIALSYVWGPAAQPNFPGASTIQALPATLEDAMRLVQILGHRYIWIDSICINQQDAQDKESQVRIMDAIYTGAWLTIVAISSDSMTSGIAGIERSDEDQVQIRCRFGDNMLVTVGQTLRQQISQSRWGSRAWTYQEAILSPRCLYIANNQLYFECNSATSCESVDDGSSPYHTADTGRHVSRIRAGASNLNFRNPFIKPEKELNWDKLEDWSDALIAQHDGQYLNYYARQLKQYSQRHMTRDSDSLNAFGGMLTRFEASWFPEGFFQGLPIKYLSKCLAWEHSGQQRRREGFPAWSWAGWEGSLARVHCFDEGPHHQQRYDNEWQVPFFKAFRAVGGHLELLFESASTEHSRNTNYSSTSAEEHIAEFCRQMQKRPPSINERLPELRRLMLSKPGPASDQSYTQLGDILPELSNWLDGFKDHGNFLDRTQLPYDPLWDLANSPCISDDDDSEERQKAERMNYLFVDCLTITLHIDAKNHRSVEIVGIQCGLHWYSDAARDRLMKIDGPKDFIVIARDKGYLQLLMVDITGKLATRVAPVTLVIPAKRALESLLRDGQPITGINLLLEGLKGWEKVDGRGNWENDEFHGILIANGALPRRRRLILT